MRALDQLREFTDSIKQKGYPVSGLNSSVFHFNYPSKMYNEFLERDDFHVVYHDVPVRGVPDHVKKAAENIPLKAVRKTKGRIVDKCIVSDKIYTFWSHDEDIIAYTLKTLEKYAELLFDAWMRENILLVWEGSLELATVTTEPERVVKAISDAGQLHLNQLVKNLGYTSADTDAHTDSDTDIPKETKKMLWAVIFMLYSKRVLNVLPG
jgi:hypothetical protein